MTELHDFVPTHRFRVECRELAMRMGFEEAEVWPTFQLLAWLLQRMAGYDRVCGELLAYAYTRQIYNQRGAGSAS